MRLQADVGRLPGSLGRQVLGHVRARARIRALVVLAACPPAHEIRGLDLDVDLGDRKLHALILADGAPEYHALARVIARPLDEPSTVADAFGGDERTLGVQAIEDVAKAFSLFADQALCRHLEIVEKEFVGLVIDHIGDRPHGHALADGLAQVDEENGHAIGFPGDLRQRCGARQQDHQVGVPDP